MDQIADDQCRCTYMYMINLLSHFERLHGRGTCPHSEPMFRMVQHGHGRCGAAVNEDVADRDNGSRKRPFLRLVVAVCSIKPRASPTAGVTDRKLVPHHRGVITTHPFAVSLLLYLHSCGPCIAMVHNSLQWPGDLFTSIPSMSV
jgi:hypothetical protein